MSAAAKSVTTPASLEINSLREFVLTGVDRRILHLVAALTWVGLFTHRKEPLLFAAVLLLSCVSKPRPLEFPSRAMMKRLSNDRLCRTWMHNNATLVGLLATHEIRPFGFHGTKKDGVEGICRDRKAMHPNYFFVAGVLQFHHPVSYLADLITATSKAEGYRHEGGGMFMIATDGKGEYGQEFGYRKYISTPDPQYACPIYLIEPDANRKFIGLIYRGRSQDQQRKPFKAGEDAPIEEVNFADEMLIPLEEKDFENRVLGLIRGKPLRRMHPLHERLCIQKIVAAALMHLLKGKNVDLHAAHKRGLKLLADEDAWKTIHAVGEDHFIDWHGEEQPFPPPHIP